MIRKATLAAILFTALLLSLVATTAGTAAARQATQLIVQSITPEVPTEPATEIKISGTLKNGNATALTGIRVQLRYSAQKFLDRAAMEAYQTGDALPPALSSRSSVDIPLVEANASVPWELTLTPVQLGLSTFGSYPLAVEVIQSGWQSIAVQRTSVTYAPETTPKLPRNKLAVALPIIDRRPPHQSIDGAFTDDGLNADLNGTGRLADLLKIAQTAPKSVTWFADPALFDDVKAAGATSWLTAMKTALAGSPVVATPYADPDIAALAHQGLDALTGKAIEQGDKVAKDLIKPDADTKTYWPQDGMIDADALDLLTVGKVSSVLLNPDNLPLDPSVTTTPDAATTIDSVSGPVTALVADRTLSHTFELDASTTSVLNRQRFIAETALIATEPGQTKPRSLVVAPSRRWNPNPEHVEAMLKTANSLPWLSMTSLSSIKPAKNPPARGELTYPEQNRGKELGKKYLDRVRSLAAQAQLTTQITKDHANQRYDLAVLRMTSAAWRNRLAAGRTATKQVDSQVDKDIAKVSIKGADRPRTLAGSDGVVPISVTNDTEHDVVVDVLVTSNNRELLQVQMTDAERLPIGPGQSGTIQVEMKATGNGDARVTVQLKTAEGKLGQGRLYADPVKLTIRTTGYTGIALVIVGAALTVMLAAVVTRVLRRRSQRRPVRGARARESERV